MLGHSPLRSLIKLGMRGALPRLHGALESHEQLHCVTPIVLFLCWQLPWVLRSPGYADTLVCLSGSTSGRNAQDDSDPLVMRARDWHVVTVTVALTSEDYQNVIVKTPVPCILSLMQHFKWKYIECCCILVSTCVSCSEEPGFNSLPRYRVSWDFS